MIEQRTIYNQTPSILTKMLWWLAGSNPELLQELPSLKIKYQIIGFTILITAIFAILTSSYAIHFVYNNIPLAITFGVFWGFVILNIDRLLITSINKNHTKFKQFFLTLLRIGLAIFIATLIAKPFELAIFKHEIDVTQMHIIHQKNQLKQVEKQLINLAEKLNQEGYNAVHEELGTLPNGSRAAGDGSITEKLEVIRDNTKLSYIETIDRKHLLEKDLNQYNDISSIINSQGLLTQLAILGTLKKSNTTIQYTSILLWLLFILIELFPVLAKILSPKDNYDTKLEELTKKERELLMLNIAKVTKNQKKIFLLKQNLELSFLTNFYTKLSDERESKTNEIFSNWEPKKQSLEELLNLLTSELNQKKIENMTKVEKINIDKKPLLQIKTPTIKAEILRPILTGLTAGGLWLIMIYALQNQILIEHIRFAIFTIIGISISSWIFYNSEQKVKEEFKNKIKNTTMEKAVTISIFFLGTGLLAILVKYSFNIEITNPQQFMEIAFTTAFAKASVDSIIV